MSNSVRNLELPHSLPYVVSTQVNVLSRGEKQRSDAVAVVIAFATALVDRLVAFVAFVNGDAVTVLITCTAALVEGLVALVALIDGDAVTVFITCAAALVDRLVAFVAFVNDDAVTVLITCTAALVEGLVALVALIDGDAVAVLVTCAAALADGLGAFIAHVPCVSTARIGAAPAQSGDSRTTSGRLGPNSETPGRPAEEWVRLRRFCSG
jgi:hypothetical protein